jgi:peptide-methionine (S)-S-oxide reductase
LDFDGFEKWGMRGWRHLHFSARYNIFPHHISKYGAPARRERAKKAALLSRIDGVHSMSQEGFRTVSTGQREVITLGGGCFWCTEAVFTQLKGVEKVESGYSGGTVANPTYEQVCTGTTGHAEAVQVTFDPKGISLKELLQIFFTMHDPTTLNRQGPDTGTQYRSVIFYHDEQQKAVAEQVIKEITEEGVWDAPIVTVLEPFKTFYTAENYHKDYFKRHPEQAYCKIVIAPKIAKLRKLYLSKLKIQ